MLMKQFPTRYTTHEAVIPGGMVLARSVRWPIRARLQSDAATFPSSTYEANQRKATAPVRITKYEPVQSSPAAVPPCQQRWAQSVLQQISEGDAGTRRAPVAR